jgi:hypothetical protein
MKYRTLILVVFSVGEFCLGSRTAEAINLVVNGDFENNSAAGNVFNPSNAVFNSTMSSVTAYGVREGIDIQTVGSGFGVAPQSGNWKVSPASDVGANAEQFSMNLSTPLTAGDRYELKFYFERLLSGTFDGGLAEIGVSNSATSFGTLVYTSAPSINGWTLASTEFIAPTNASFLTVRPDTTGSRWIGLDNFSLSPVPEPSSLVLLGIASLSVIGARRKFARSMAHGRVRRTG